MKKRKLNIIYEDKELLIIDKPSNLLTIATQKDKVHTLYHEVREYIRTKNQKIFIVNRLDKDTSGIVVFSKNEKLKYLLQNNWNDITNRYYYAVVEGNIKENHGCLKNYLKENKMLNVYVTDDNNGKLAILNYDVIKKNNSYSLLNINIKTGRKNQIRCQLDYINHPIIGDKKYKSKKNPIGRLGLHAYKLELIHPINNKKYVFETKKINQFFDIFKQ